MMQTTTDQRQTTDNTRDELMSTLKSLQTEIQKGLEKVRILIRSFDPILFR